jgi:hypothetical protein
LAKAVLAGTTTIVGLVGALHATLLDGTRPKEGRVGTERRNLDAAMTRS